MSFTSGPRIVLDNLVMYLDSSNIKSYRGEPTTNQIVGITWNGDGSAQAVGPKTSSRVTDSSLMYNGYETYLWTPASSLNCYLDGVDLSDSRSSSLWAFSCYIKKFDGTPIPNLNVYMYYPSSDGSAAGTIESCGDGWYRVSRLRSSGSLAELSLVGFTFFEANVKYYLSGAQLEKKAHITPFVSTNTTRNDTASFFDLIGDTVPNLVSMGFDSSGSMTFVSASANFITVPSTNAIVPTSSMTWEVWAKATSTAGYRPLFGKSAGTNSTGYISVFFNPNSLANIRLNASDVAEVTRSIDYTTVIPVTINQYFQFALVYNGSNFLFYKNGKHIETSTSWTNGLGNNAFDFTIGSNWIGYWIGEIPIFKIYNKILSSSEILQNYNAIRSRFGL